MINVAIAFDDKDENLGNYFLNCKDDISGFFNDQKHLLKETPIFFPSEKCDQTNIDVEIAKINVAPFIFIAYSHGNENSLRCNGNSYVKKGINTNNFSKSLFYTNSCLSGKHLGKELVDNGCFAFIGYVEEIEAPLDKGYEAISINCDNSGIKTFLSDDIPISKAFTRMRNYYTKNIDKYRDIDPFFAAMLVKNRESLVFHGNNELKKEDLFV